MPERGRSPGVKGTAFPHAQRPQKVTRPAVSKGGVPFNAPAGKKPVPPAAPAAPLSRASLVGKTLRLPAKPDQDLTSRDSLRSQKNPADATFAGKLPAAQPAAKKTAQPWSGKPAVKPTGKPTVKPVAKPPVASAPRTAPPRPPVDPDAPVRISKLLAERGYCSRREADSYIERGWVLLDGVPVTELGTKARPDAVISLAREAAQQQSRLMTILLHKPVGYVSGQPEPGFQPAVVLIQPQNQARGPGDLAFEPRWMKDLAPAGRLDIDSTGLLVLTQDGRIARQLIGDDSEVEKEYLVRVEGKLVANGLKLLNHGLSLDGKPLRPAKVEWLNDDQLRFILREGKKRQIRRMCELVGLNVVGLKRVRMGRVKLGDLPLGQWRYLRPGEQF